MRTITRLSPAEFETCVKELAALLADAVDGGFSLGFVMPFDIEDAAAWWRAQAPAVAAGELIVWACREDGAVVGTVGLVPSPKANSRHRGEIIKLIVHREARNRGHARALLATAEREASAAGLDLLMLDTETGSAAEHVYLTCGWTRFGSVPDYAGSPDGTLRECSFFYKRLTATA
ncbi:GNAT family N-acetyltransferase [Nonomuraea sp. NPDC049421]|uniref:GNAT family N-acetyltransferase n=1 Tax=Nonomuraea sp. NPDC049421 TaxID=3155275 RepID=UPI003416C8C8